MSKILVPLDGSAFAEQAVETARSLAARLDADVEFLTVHEPEPPLARLGGAPVRDPLLDTELRASLRDYIMRIEGAERARSTFPVTAVFREGAVAEEVVAQVSAGGASLVVMTTHGRGGIGRFWLGSVADRVIRSATVPVLLVRVDGAAAAPLERLVVAIAGSDEDEQIVATVSELVDLPRARITLAHAVLPSPTIAAMVPVVGPPPNEMAGVPAPDMSVGLRAADRHLESLAVPLRARGAAVDIRVVPAGSAARAVLDVGTDVEADLIVVGTAARPPVARMFIGSVADKIVRSAPCSVLVCPAKPRQAAAP
ncbi:MAG TPA: universal stress protein [Gemmatimonadaceae bacterium]|nr:universal stress protein [Gemmatimonadaceae bacterium]